MAKAVRQSDASAYAHILHRESTRTLALRGVGGVQGTWGWGGNKVHYKYNAELERVQDGEQKSRLGGREKKKQTRKCEGSVKQNEREEGRLL